MIPREQGEIIKHPPSKGTALLSPLTFRLYMQQKTGCLLPKARFDDKVGIPFLTDRQFGEEFFVEKLYAGRIKIVVNAGQKQFDEFDEEFSRQFFEKLIVVNHKRGIQLTQRTCELNFARHLLCLQR